MSTRDVIIIGSGPAGLTAALYTARANLEPLLIEGLESGGQLMLTTDVENYPGFREGIMGPELMTAMRGQAERFGTEFVTGDVTKVGLGQSPFSVTTTDTTYQTRSLIIATGGTRSAHRRSCRRRPSRTPRSLLSGTRRSTRSRTRRRVW